MTYEQEAGRIKRGGSRPNAGRKTPDGATGLIRYQVTLDFATADKLRTVGAGNLSAGIREAARQINELSCKPLLTPDSP